MAADPSPSHRTGALRAAIVHKVRVTLGHFAVLEASVQAVVVLVALTSATLVQARGATSAALQRFLDAVVQLRTVHAGAVMLAQAQSQAEEKQSTC